MDEGLIELNEFTSGKIGPPRRCVEDLLESEYEADRFEIVIPTCSGIIMGELFRV